MRRVRFDATIPAMQVAVYPGSFDPITHGHLDLIQRAARLFDRVVVAVAESEAKRPLFSMEERSRLAREATADIANVEVDVFTCLLIDYVLKRKAKVILRGLRAVSDFEFEFQLALTNRRINDQVETMFMMPRDTYTFLSSRIVKEIGRLGGDVSPFVPAPVRDALMRRLGDVRKGSAAR